MGNIELKDDEKELEIVSTEPLKFGNSLVQTLNTALDELHKGANIITFAFELLSGIQYRYTMTTANGRVWTQLINIPTDPTQEAEMNFTVPDFWKEESEFAKHRGVRGTCIHLARTQSVTEIECTWF